MRLFRLGFLVLGGACLPVAACGGDMGAVDSTAAGGTGDPGSGGASSGGTPGSSGGAVDPGSGGANPGSGGAASGGAETGGAETGGASSGGNGGATNGCAEPAPGENPNRVCIKGKNYYLNGINVAWDQWTQDLTNYNAANFETLFATLEAAGANSVRWWWFIDGENQMTFQGNLAQPLAQGVFDNLDVAFDAAAAHGILLMPSLLSFDIETPGRQFLVTDEAATDAFVQNVVAPLVERYNDHAGMGLWEIMNEGDWLLTDEGGIVSIADYQRFHAKVAAGIHAKVAAGIHAADADALVTTGSASYKYLSDNNIFADAALIAAADGDAGAVLDVYQTHYYSWQHGEGWSYEPWIKSSTEWLPLGKPILVGEFSCKGEAGRWTSMQMHVESVNQGYAGTFCWAYYDNRADDEGAWVDAQAGVEAIGDQIPTAITGE